MNRLSVYTNSTAIMTNDNTTSYINNLASDSALVSVAMYNIMNCVN